MNNKTPLSFFKPIIFIADTQDAEQVTSMSIHPSGDFLAVATEGPVVRFYDINSCQCYVCPYPREHHTGPLTCVRYSADARVCVSASKDGHVKVEVGLGWEGLLHVFD